MRNTRLSKRLMFPLTALAFVVACLTTQSGQPQAPQKPDSDSKMVVQPEGANSSRLRSVDFSNFTYPWVADLADPKKTFTLVRGKYSGKADLVPMELLSVAYGDVTGDEREEAIVALTVVVERAPAAPNVIYIYAGEDAPPKLLWAFSTGDRSDGGLRRVYGDRGKLIVELYGKGKVVGTDLYSDDGSRAEVPYPYYYTRTRYEWTGNDFRPAAPPETLSNPESYGAPIMPAYRQSD